MPSKLCLGLIGAAALLLGAEASASEAAGPNIDSIVQTVRSQIELYRVQHDDELPWAPGKVAQKQWAPLVDENYLQGAPRNPLSPPSAATRIIELTEPGDTGRNVDPSTAGWAWNSTDHSFYPIGRENWHRAVEQQARRSWIRTMAVASVIVLLVVFYLARAVVDALPMRAR